jgi:hypothetical protein
MTMPSYTKGLSGISFYAEEKIAEAAKKAFFPYFVFGFFGLLSLFISHKRAALCSL